MRANIAARDIAAAVSSFNINIRHMNMVEVLKACSDRCRTLSKYQANIGSESSSDHPSRCGSLGLSLTDTLASSLFHSTSRAVVIENDEEHSGNNDYAPTTVVSGVSI